MIDAKSLHNRFNKKYGFISVYNGTRYLVSFGIEKFDFIYSRFRYLTGVASGNTYVISHSYAKIKVDLCDSLPLEKTLTFHDVIILFNQFLINIEISTTIINSKEKFRVNCLKISFCIKYKYYIIIELSIRMKRMQCLSLFVFFNKGFKFQRHVCNRYHDLLMFMNLSAIFNI